MKDNSLHGFVCVFKFVIIVREGQIDYST